MLNMGFIEDINTILASVPSERQTLLFSATMPGPIRKIAETFMKNPEMVKIKSKEMTVENIEQFFVKSKEREKFDILSRLLMFNNLNLQSFLVVQNVVLMNFHMH